MKEEIQTLIQNLFLFLVDQLRNKSKTSRQPYLLSIAERRTDLFISFLKALIQSEHKLSPPELHLDCFFNLRFQTCQ